jgi:FkbM family methyltransferase
MTSRHLFAVWLAGAAFVLLAAILLAAPGSRHSLWIAIGRSYCKAEAAAQTGKQHNQREQLRKRLERAARIVGDDGGFVQWEVEGESYWMPAGSRILPALLADQKLEMKEPAGFAVRPGDVVLDCGANIGLSTMAAIARGAARVIAVEPALDNVECLRRNLAGPIAEGRVLVYPKGVWDKDDVLPLNVQPSNTASYSVVLRRRGATPGPSVELTTIDKLVGELGLPRVDYIKMDIEGSERAALSGGAGTIRRFHPRLTVSLEYRYDDPEAIPDMVRSLWSGYIPVPGRCVEQNAGLRPASITFEPAE